MAELIVAVEGVARACEDLAQRILERLLMIPAAQRAADDKACAGGDLEACLRQRQDVISLAGFCEMFAVPARERLVHDVEVAERNLAIARATHRSATAKLPKTGAAVQEGPLRQDSVDAAKLPPVAIVQDDRKVDAQPLPKAPTATELAGCKAGDGFQCLAVAAKYRARRELASALAWLSVGCAAKRADCCAQAGVVQDEVARVQPSAKARAAALAWHERACSANHGGGCHRAAAAYQVRNQEHKKMLALTLKACHLGECSDCRALHGTYASLLAAAQQAEVAAAVGRCAAVIDK
ncbi:MAG: hypothetical protein EXR77_15975 [Myxococcales bacterium]|nr:hypothetical protein [Myxococcales bacterium]